MNYDFNMYPFDVEISISSTKVKSNYENNKKNDAIPSFLYSKLCRLISTSSRTKK